MNAESKTEICVAVEYVDVTSSDPNTVKKELKEDNILPVFVRSQIYSDNLQASLPAKSWYFFVMQHYLSLPCKWGLKWL